MLSNFLKRTITSITLITVLGFCLYYNDISWRVLVIFFLCVCFYEFYNLINKINLSKIFKLLIIFLISLYLYFFYLLVIRITIEFGKEIILILLVACIFSDIGGYVVGKVIGGRKLISISPNKTISGALGSIIFTIFGTSLLIILLKKAKVKDTGNILPGHGGILDRVDGIIFAIPFGFYTYNLLIFNSSV